MHEKILVLTDKKICANKKIVCQQMGRLRNHKQKYLLSIDNATAYILCIIEFQASVPELLYLTHEVRKFYSLPTCIFESNIIEKYPGEKEKLRGKVDILIRRAFDKREFFSLIDYILDLKDTKNLESEEIKLELTDSNDLIQIYPGKRNLYINNTAIRLTKKEFDIFYYLFQKKGDVVSHKELYERVWKREYIHDDTNIMAHIHRLRGKVEKDPKEPKYICNQYGVGYYFGGLSQEALPTLWIDKKSV